MKQGQQAAAAPTADTQLGRMQAAIGKTVTFAPRFLRGEVKADDMANTMVGAVKGYVEQERSAGSDGRPQNAQAQQLQQVLSELMACGSGYLAGRCDGACVARTMTYMVQEFGAQPDARA